MATGPDGRCIDSIQQSICHNGPTAKCLTSDQCVLSSIQPAGILDNGIATEEQQTYICSSNVTTCTKLAEVNGCLHFNAWGFDQGGLSNQLGTGLAEANTALAKLDGIQKGMALDDPYIFSGQALQCHYPIGNFLNAIIMIVVAIVIIYFTGGAAAGTVGEFLSSGSIASSTTLIINPAIL
jgi:hypothetical protein